MTPSRRLMEIIEQDKLRLLIAHDGDTWKLTCFGPVIALEDARVGYRRSYAADGTNFNDACQIILDKMAEQGDNTPTPAPLSEAA